MREFFDTSVLVAAFWGGHPHHQSSLQLLAAANPRQSACGTHSIAEVYATMTALPLKPVIPPEQALLFIEELRERLTPVALDSDEYFATVRASADHHLFSGQVYDALLLRCAAKIKARTVYTWNVKHFQAIAPELARRIRTP